MLNRKKVLEQFKSHQSLSEGNLAKQQTEARNSHRFHNGDTMAYTSSVQDKGRRISVTFNKVKPYIDAVAGFMVQLRRKPDYRARIMENQQQQSLSEYMNGISDYVRKNANFDQIESRQDREMLISGYAAVDTNILYEKNPDGEVWGENLRFSDVLWDSQAMEPNILDSRWVIRRKAFGMDEALQRFKGSTEEDFEGYTGDHNSSFNYNPAGGEYDKIAASGEQEEDLIQVHYYQYWHLENYYRADNPLYDIEDPEQANMVSQLMMRVRDNRAEVSDEDVKEDIFAFDPTAEILSMTPTIKSDLALLFERFGLEFEPIKDLKRVYYTAIVSGQKVFQHFKSPDQQGFTIKFKTANYDANNRLWYGLVHTLREPSRYMNKALTEMLYAIAANSKGGVMYEESAVDNPKRFEQQYATTAAAIRVNDGAIAGGKIQPKAMPALPTGYENIYGLADAAIAESSGINKEFLGTANNSQVSALLESQRVNQVVSTLATYFDAISLYQIEHARMMVTFIKMIAENSENRLISVIGQDGALNFEQLTQSRMVDEYDVDIGEAPTSPTQRSETAVFMMGVADKMALMGVNMYDMAIKYAPNIKESDKQQILQRMQPDPEQQAAQAEREQQQLQQQAIMNQAILDERAASTAQKIASAESTMASIGVDADKKRAETTKVLAEAEQKDAENRAIETLPIGNINVTI
jgi:hypothetical protein